MRTATKAFPTRIILTGIGILCLALVFNTCRLAAVPPGLDRDAAANGLMALKWLREGVFPFWMSHASAPEPLIVWLQTLSTAIFGPSVFALRIVSAVAISFSAVVVYVLTFEVARWMNADARYYAALFAGLASAVNPVMTELGRTGLRATTLPLVSGLFFIAMLVALRNGKYPWYLLAGTLLGLTAYTYLASRFLTIVVLLYLVLFCVTNRCNGTRLTGIGLMMLAALLVILPQLHFFIDYPGAFFERAQAVSLAHNPLLAEKGPIDVVLRKLAGIVLMFGVHWGGQYNQSARPLLTPVSFAGLIFVLPVLWRRWREPGMLLMAVTLPVMFLPDLVAGDRLMPHELRVIGSFLPAFVLSGIGLACAVSWVQTRKQSGRAKYLSPAIALILVLWPLTDWATNVAPRLADSDYEWYSFREVQSAMVISEASAPLLVPLSEYSRPVVAYLTAGKIHKQNSALDVSGQLRMPQHDNASIYWPADAERSRIESVSYLFDPRSLVLIDGDQAFLMPPTVDAPDALRQQCGLLTNKSIEEAAGELCAADLQKALAIAGNDMPRWSVNAVFDSTYFLESVSADTATLISGAQLGTTSYWKVQSRPQDNLRYFIHLLDDRQQMIAGEDLIPGYGVYATDVWKAGETVPVNQLVRLPEKLQPGRYWLEIGLYDRLSGDRAMVVDASGGQTDRVLVGPLKVALNEPTELSDGQASHAVFGATLMLHEFEPIRSEDELIIRMLLSAVEPPEIDYTFFVHLVNSSGELIAQSDVQPLNGAYPTSIWDAGESVIVEANVPLADDLPAGDYTLWMGVYDTLSGDRLPIDSDDAQVDQSRLKLDEIRLP